MYNNNSNGNGVARARRFVVLCTALLAYGVLGAVVPSTPAHAQSFSGLGFLTGGNASRAQSVNAEGTVVVGVGNTAGIPQEAFRWTQAGGMAGLGFLPGGSFSQAQAVNADGAVVVGFGNATGTSGFRKAFRWTQTGGMVDLGFLRPPGQPGGVFSEAFGVNADGTVVVGFGSSFSVLDPDAFRWTPAGGLADLFGLGNFSQAQGVNADGTIAVGFGDTGALLRNVEAIRWTQAGPAGLGFLPGGINSEAFGVNAKGTVVVGFGDATGTGAEAFRWTQAGGMMGLGFLTGGTTSQALGVNADGAVVVGFGNAAGISQEAFRWTQTDGMQSVQALLTAKGVSTTGWTLTDAQGVSADGQVIVGFGTDPNGRTQGWIANLGPTFVPFLAFSAKLEIDLDRHPNEDRFKLNPASP